MPKLSNLTSDEQKTLRHKDLRSLTFVLRHPEALDADAVERAQDIMLDLNRGQVCMTEKQRRLVRVFCTLVDPSFNTDDDPRTPDQRNANVPSGAPVETPEVLRRLPLKPPGMGGNYKAM